MKYCVMMFLFLSGALALQAQTERRIYTSAERENNLSEEERAQSRAEQKRQQALSDSIAFAKAMESIEQLSFVLEADWVTFKRGERVFVSSNTNFISISDDRAVVQVSPVLSGGGPNGVGGITLEGRGSDFVLSTDKNGNVTLRFNVNGSGLSATVTLSMPEGSCRATSKVSPNFHSNTVTLSGLLLPLAESRIFEGQSLF